MYLCIPIAVHLPLSSKCYNWRIKIETDGIHDNFINYY